MLTLAVEQAIGNAAAVLVAFGEQSRGARSKAALAVRPYTPMPTCVQAVAGEQASGNEP